MLKTLKKLNFRNTIFLFTEPGVKKHVCTTCGKAFTRSYALTRHIVSHTKVKNYICKICGQAYCDLRGLKTHQKQMHAANFLDVNTLKDPDPKTQQQQQQQPQQHQQPHHQNQKHEIKASSQNMMQTKNPYVPNVPNTSSSSNNNVVKDLTTDNSYHHDPSGLKNKIFQPIKFVEDNATATAATASNNTNSTSSSSSTNRHINNTNQQHRVEHPINTPSPYLPNIPKKLPNSIPTIPPNEPFQDNYSYLKRIHEYKINSQTKFCQNFFDYSNSNLSPQNMCLLTNQEKFYNNLNIKNLNGNHFAQQFGFNDILNVWNLDGHQMPPPNFHNSENFNSNGPPQRMWK